MAYREALNVLNPVCEQYEYRYIRNMEYSQNERESDFIRLTEARAEGERIIKRAHVFSCREDSRTNYAVLQTNERDNGEEMVGKAR